MLVALPLQKGERKGRERERERVCVCVCWLCVSRFNNSKTRTEGGKAQCKTGARLRHYLPVAHSAACGSLYSVCSYLQTRLLVHNDEKMVVRKGNDRSTRALPCGISRVWGNLSPACVHALHLPGALKIDPPGSTHQWCFLWLESSTGDTKCGVLPLK